jgi:hypothetical protein
MNIPTHAAYLQHEDWQMPRFYLGNSAEEAEKKATEALMEITGNDWDTDEYPTEENWIDCCLSEGWAIDSGEIVGQ